jgi:glycosyltransferase involved in cell wall biosynthesis
MTDGMMPLFSVVIPVHDRADVLKPALASVVAQSCADFEVIVVDDGSSDDPARVVAGFADPRLSIVRQENRGACAARNRGIDLARGRYVAFLDSDDRFLPHHLETMARLLDGRTDTAGYARMIVNRGGGRRLVKPPRALRAGEHMAIYLLCDRGFVPTITLVVPRTIAARVRYDETVSYGDDKDFAIRLFLAGCNFAMADAPGAVWNDVYDPARLSAGRRGASLLPWIERMRPRLPARAYYGCRGWAIAKGVAATSKPAAFKLFVEAVLHGAYRPAMAARIFLQIFLPDRVYRRLADATLAKEPDAAPGPHPSLSEAC